MGMCSPIAGRYANSDSVSVHLTLASHLLIGWKKPSELASTWVSLLVRYQGYLRLLMTATARQQHHEVKVVHVGSEWRLDGTLWLTAPQTLDFDHMSACTGKAVQCKCDLYF